MRRIDGTRHRRPIPGWVWLLLAIALFALLWLLLRWWTGAAPPATILTPPTAVADTTTPPPSPRDVIGALRDATATPTAASEVPPPAVPDLAADPLFDLLTLVDAPNQVVLVGRPVLFANVRVQRLASEQAFFAGPDPSREVLVVLEAATRAAGGTPQPPPISPGQDLTIAGVVQPFPGFAELEGTQVYVAAERIEPAVAESAQAPLFDLLVLVPDEQSFAGRPAVFANVRVQQVIGDRACLVGPNASQTVLVVLDEGATPQDPTTAGRTAITAGQDVTIYGAVRPLPAVEERAGWGVVDPGQVAGREVYVHAARVEIVTP